MKNIYIVHTQFNTVYSEIIQNDQFKIFKEETIGEGRRPVEKVNGFSASYGISLVYYKSSEDNSLVVEENPTDLNNTADEVILVVSDDFYNRNSKEIKSLLNNLLSTDCKLYPIYHQRATYSSFVEYFEEQFENKIQLESVFKYSHFTSDQKSFWNDNPFCVLAELVNVNTKEDFEKRFTLLKEFVDSEEETLRKKQLNKKLKVLYKILGQSYQISAEDKAAIKELDSQINLDNYTADIENMRFLRDTLLKDVI